MVLYIMRIYKQLSSTPIKIKNIIKVNKNIELWQWIGITPNRDPYFNILIIEPIANFILNSIDLLWFWLKILKNSIGLISGVHCWLFAYLM